MGMLIRRHRDRHEDEPPRKRPPRKRKGKAPAHESLAGDDYAALSDEQVAEAYATTIPDGEAAERDAQVAEMRALNIARDTFADQPTEGGSDGE